MDGQVYTISQAAKEVGESTSVLRYWEDVLEIRVNRNEKGYRCYTGYDIQLFLNIKELKKRGLKLDAIRELIPKIYQYGPGSPKNKTRLLEDSSQNWTIEEAKAEETEEPAKKAGQVQETDNSNDIAGSGEVPVRVGREEDLRILEFQNIMEKLIAQGLKEKNQEELRIRKLDEKIRFHQQGLKQVAAAHEMKQKRGRKKKRGNRRKR